MPKTEPTPTEPIEQADGSLVWPTDPDYEPTAIAEQNLSPSLEPGDPDYEAPDDGADPDWEDTHG